ncbi:LuxR C-terminal-related transcriptional regulator [Streptomyces sp. NPDC058316]|uniref:LuxR C-terminal-related transcriptional regulator n=1 Tax=unclassified Streptomyces TaxID=2593676 RepID=UPI00331E0577
MSVIESGPATLPGENPVVTDRTTVLHQQTAPRTVPTPAATATQPSSLGVRGAASLQVGLKDGRRAVSTVFTFSGLSDRGEHLALSFGDAAQPSNDRAPLVGVHMQCLNGEALGSLHCDCGDRLQDLMQDVCDADGLLLYLRHTGRGTGCYGESDVCPRRAGKPVTYDSGRPPGRSEADADCTLAAEMLATLGLPRIRLRTDDPRLVRGLVRLGITVGQTVRPGAPTPRRKLNCSQEQGDSVSLDTLVTPREYDVLRRVALGQSNPEIAAALFISRNTVKGYLQNALQKLNARNRVEAIAKARELGILL